MGIITKDEIIKEGVHYIMPEYIPKLFRGELLHVRTSGSTGKYLDIYWDRAEYCKSMLPLWLLRRKYYGISPLDKMSYFYTPTAEDGDFRYYHNELGFSKNLLNVNQLSTWYEKMVEFEPKWLILQPSTAVILNNFLKQNDLKPIKMVRYVEFSGEILTEEVRKITKEMFQCQIADQYGANEVNSIAYECPYGKMHVMGTNVVVEVVSADGNIVSDSRQKRQAITKSEEGRLLLTSLTNKAMPFIQYDIGDWGKLSAVSCPCGNCNAVLTLTSGRANDNVIFSDGTKTSSYLFVQIFDQINEFTDGAVLQFYIEQKDFLFFYVRICKDEEIEAGEIKAYFLNIVQNTKIAGAQFFFDFTDVLFHTEESRKHAYFKCKIGAAND